jgi:hypothetical protein
MWECVEEGVVGVVVMMMGGGVVLACLSLDALYTSDALSTSECAETAGPRFQHSPRLG